MTSNPLRREDAKLTVDSVLYGKNNRESGNHFGKARPKRCAAAENPGEKLV